MKKGIFITFEGIDGAGKSTQRNMLRSYLEKKGKTVVVTREPGGTDIGGKIRALLLDRTNTGMCGMAELLLYYADRAQHINEFILPELNAGKCVICDRYYDSSYAYQLAGRGIDISALDELNDMVVKNVKPDATFLLDISPDSSESRIVSRGGEKDRMEEEAYSFKCSVRNGFIEQAKLHPERIHVIDAMQSPEKIFDEILLCLDNIEL